MRTTKLRTVELVGGPHDGAKTKATERALLVVVNGEHYVRGYFYGDRFVHQPKGSAK